jgi:hypothetical protein
MFDCLFISGMRFNKKCSSVALKLFTIVVGRHFLSALYGLVNLQFLALCILLYAYSTTSTIEALKY